MGMVLLTEQRGGEGDRETADVANTKGESDAGLGRRKSLHSVKVPVQKEGKRRVWEKGKKDGIELYFAGRNHRTWKWWWEFLGVPKSERVTEWKTALPAFWVAMGAFK